MKRYQFLLFDADGTLLDFETACAHAFQRTYFAQGLDLQKPYSAQLLESYRKNNENWWGKLERGECTRPQLYLGRFADFLQENGLSGDPQALHEAYFPLLGEGGDLLPGAEELVKRLKAAGYFLYLITNGKASTQRVPDAVEAGVGSPLDVRGERISDDQASFSRKTGNAGKDIIKKADVRFGKPGIL